MALRLAKLILNHLEAVAMHQDFFDGEFEVVKATRSGSFDIPPWSWFYGASDINSWVGLISTDGNKVIFTEGGWLKERKISRKWDVDAADIKAVDKGTFKTKFSFTKDYDGLTTPSPLEALLLLGLFFIPFLLYERRKVRFRIQDEFNNRDKFYDLISQGG